MCNITHDEIHSLSMTLIMLLPLQMLILLTVVKICKHTVTFVHHAEFGLHKERQLSIPHFENSEINHSEKTLFLKKKSQYHSARSMDIDYFNN